MFPAVADTIVSGTDLTVDALTDDELRRSLQASAVLLGCIQVLQARLLTEAHSRQLWRRDGFRSLATWLADKTAMTAHDARRAVDTATIISTRADIAASMAEGQISPAHVAVIRSLADEDATAEPAADATEPTGPPVDPADLLAAACTQSPEAFARHARVLRAQADPEGEARRYLVRRSHRSLGSWTDADGLLHLHLAIDPGFGAIVERAISAMCEERWRRDHPDRAPTLEPRAPRTTNAAPMHWSRSANACCRVTVSAQSAVRPSMSWHSSTSTSSSTHHQMVHLEKWQLRGGPGNSIETYRPDGSRCFATRDHASRNSAAHRPRSSPLPSYGPAGAAATYVTPVT